METPPYDSTQDTLDHIQEVRNNLDMVSLNLCLRGIAHDRSKLEHPEKPIFDRVNARLKDLTYGTPAYEASLTELGPALSHHYAHNSHHPQHFAGGISDMSLLDIVEMLCDWKAATARHSDGDMAKSLEINRERFNISDELYAIMHKTAVELKFIC